MNNGSHCLSTFDTYRERRMGSQMQSQETSPSCSSASDAARGALLCTSIAAESVATALDTISAANESGADVLELRLDFYRDFNGMSHLQQLLDACNLPTIATFRPEWEGYGVHPLLIVA
jgi:hypothetical protein